jgi:hypothetical protein
MKAGLRISTILCFETMAARSRCCSLGHRRSLKAFYKKFPNARTAPKAHVGQGGRVLSIISVEDGVRRMKRAVVWESENKFPSSICVWSQVTTETIEIIL